MKLRPPKSPKTRPLSRHKRAAVERIMASDPPLVMVEIKESGLHYSIANGGLIGKEIARSLIGLGVLVPHGASLIDGMTPGSYRLSLYEGWDAPWKEALRGVAAQ